METKFKQGESVVYKNIVWVVAAIWFTKDPMEYDLMRLYPKTSEYYHNVSEDKIQKWDGTLKAVN